MADLIELGAAEAAGKIAAGNLTAEALMEAYLARIDARDGDVEAWIWLDRDRAMAEAREADRVLALGYGVGPLHGVPVAIKDIIETEDMPTQNGYVPHEGRWTGRDAAAVSALRDAGAIIMGKTVTTELAARTPGKTRNPHNPAHTPGGSSSGSAAAVGDRQVPLALGTQTGGSVIRPASFCGIYALKPTFGLIQRTGATLQADWLDTIGVYGNSILDVALATEQMTARDQADPQAGRRSRAPLSRIAMGEASAPPRIAFMRTSVWDRAESHAQSAMEDFATKIGADTVEMPDWMAEAWRWQRVLQLYDNARYYGPLADAHPEGTSQSMHENIAEGRGMTEAEYRHAIAQRDPVHDGLMEIYAEYDAILCLSSAGPAPSGLDFTGDPAFNAFWTYVGTPCVNLPLLTVDGMPMGVQLTGPRGADGPLLRTARLIDELARS